MFHSSGVSDARGYQSTVVHSRPREGTAENCPGSRSPSMVLFSTIVDAALFSQRAQQVLLLPVNALYVRYPSRTGHAACQPRTVHLCTQHLHLVACACVQASSRFHGLGVDACARVTFISGTRSSHHILCHSWVSFLRIISVKARAGSTLPRSWLSFAAYARRRRGNFSTLGRVAGCLQFTCPSTVGSSSAITWRMIRCEDLLPNGRLCSVTKAQLASGVDGLAHAPPRHHRAS